LAQTTSSTVEMKDFEVIAVDGNKLVFRDQTGAREITVPDDFRFTIDGKKMAVSELKPGMKGTATVTTTTTVTPVVVTEVREAEVLRASDLSMTVRGADGNTRRFTQGDVNKRGIEIVKDGKAVRIADLKRGDKLTAIIITEVAPAVLTEQEVQATLAEPTPQPAPTTAAAPEPAKAAEPEATKMAAATPAQPAAMPAATPAPSAATPVSPPAESSGLGNMTWLLIAIAVAIVLFLFLRRRKQA
jgi:hypothetical protein